MSDSKANMDSLLHLADEVCAENASADDLAALDALLLSDDESRRCYLDYCQMHIALGLELQAQDAVQTLCRQIDGVTVEAMPPSAYVVAPLSFAPIPQTPTLCPAAFQGIAGYLSSGWPVAYLVATVILAIGALVGSVIYVSHPVQVARQSVPSPVSSLPSVVGRITGMVHCKWKEEAGDRGQQAGNGMQDSPLSPLPSPLIRLGDKFALASGLMEITYDTGAKVILQGPVTYEVESKNGGFLSVGKLTAKVEKRAEGGGRKAEEVAGGPWSVAGKSEIKNMKSEMVDSPPSSNPQSLIPNPSSLSTLHSPLFTVTTPTAVVTDLGTEFGVCVDRNGATDTEVFRGIVRVMHCGETGGAANSRMVTAGEAVRMDLQQPAIEVATAQRVAFARELPRRELPHPYTMRDHFDVVHNYLTDGTAGTIWSGILNADKASRIDTLPIEIDGVRHGGQLVMAVPENSQTGWSEPARGHTFKNAPYLYVNAPKGDFEARVQFGEITQDLYSNCSLMARLDDDNFLSVGRHEFGPRCFMVRSQQQGVDSDNFGTAEISGRFAMRLVRRGDAFFASYSIDGGETWQAMDWLGTGTAMHRPDLSGPIQVGLWYGTFSDVEGHVAFQDFSLRLSQEQPSEPGKRGANGGIDTEKR